MLPEVCFTRQITKLLFSGKFTQRDNDRSAFHHLFQTIAILRYLRIVKLETFDLTVFLVFRFGVLYRKLEWLKTVRMRKWLRWRPKSAIKLRYASCTLKSKFLGWQLKIFIVYWKDRKISPLLIYSP